MAKQVDTATQPNLGLRTSDEFFAIPEMASDYQTDDETDDTFEELVDCVNAVWARFIKLALWEINEVLACRRSVPLSDKIGGGGGTPVSGEHWRAGDDNIHSLTGLAGFDWPIASPPDRHYKLNGTGSPDGAGPDFVNDTTPANVRLGFAVASMKGSEGPGAPDANKLIVGLNSTADRFYWLDASGEADEVDVAFFMTFRRQWNQGNDRVVLASVRRFDTDSETGATDRMAWEFGLGPYVDGGVWTGPGALPAGDEQDMVLYLRYYDAADQMVHVCCAIDPVQFALTPGTEWHVGFNRFETQDPDAEVVFYINGVRIAAAVDLPIPGDVGSSPNIRLMLGSANGGKRYVGGPMRNVYFYNDHGGVIDDDLVNELYQKSAGFEEPSPGGG